MYQRSEQHKENCRKAASLGFISQQETLNRKKQEYYNHPKKCLNCETTIPYEKKRENKFCQKSCSATFNNKARGPHSEKTKIKIAETTKQAIEHLFLSDLRKRAEMTQKTCSFCKATFSVKKTRRKQTFCSSDCKIGFHKTDETALQRAREKGQSSVQKQMLEGKWKGWSGIGEDVRSFPESYIEKKILEDGLSYKFQHQVSRYKIDFAFLQEKIALEVDGKQHLRHKQLESDKRKDEVLKLHGWRVFRLTWKSIKKESGMRQVEQQYQDFKDLLTAK